MKKMKFFVLLVCVLALVSSCATVGGGAGSSMDRISKKGELVVGTAGSMPPLNMTTKTGEVIGYEMDIARSMADAMGVKLRVETMPFADLMPALEAGKVDMILSGMTIIPVRNMKAAFVGPYYESGKAFLTKYDKIASAKDSSEVNNTAIALAALRGSTSQAFVEALIPQAKLMLTANYDEAVQLVIQGKVDALVADYPICVVSVLRYPDQKLIASLTPLTYEPIGIALPPNDPLLVNWVQNYMNALEGSGQLKAFGDRWFKDGSWIKDLK